MENIRIVGVVIMKPLVIGIDFDGTIVKHKYPKMGEPIENCLEVIERLSEVGHKIVLYTMRNGERLADAVEYLEHEGVELYGVNDNPTQKHWAPDSRKVFCHVYIDDAALGCPLVHEGARPYVDWYAVEHILEAMEII